MPRFSNFKTSLRRVTSTRGSKPVGNLLEATSRFALRDRLALRASSPRPPQKRFPKIRHLLITRCLTARFREKKWLIRRKRAPEVFKAWLQYPMIDLWDVIINVRLALPGETEPSSNGVDLSSFTRVSRASVFASVRLVRAERQLQATCKTPSPDRSPLRACPGGISEASRVTAGTSPKRSTVSTSHFFGSCQLVPPPRQARRKDVSQAAIA
ncbi:hypothetical protein CA85_42910 [Allorhodopirellula solitaria]|uniref:Uncharacterized protein n=1 Tax=Allorhodopirellula solitaria TaxID=2527987 RepID=A0A5C5X0F0_9BACT|nr:hypothetical protein CA85_42910 [Allorhodopirellula solitaria]